MSSRHLWLKPAAISAGLLLPALAQAHPGHGDSAGFLAGVLHPLSGLDHLLALLAVGLLAGRLAGRATWLLLAGYLCLLVQGAAMGLAGIQLPFAQAVVLLSIGACALLAIAPPRRLQGAIIALAAFFAFFHGYSHGSHAVDGSSGWQFLSGLAVASAAILIVVSRLAAALNRLPLRQLFTSRPRSPS